MQTLIMQLSCSLFTLPQQCVRLRETVATDQMKWNRAFLSVCRGKLMEVYTHLGFAHTCVFNVCYLSETFTMM